MKFVLFTRPDGSKIAIDCFYVTAIRPPMKNEHGNCVLEPSRQQVMETFEQALKMLESEHDDRRQ